ncbi:MAG: glycosyltransferase [Armatimonadetes bacterium]|nr:glycosyltransferase [Armatimonadota bacterium]
MVLDMRDMHPDIFLDHVPRVLAPFARMAIKPMAKQAATACQRASAIIGITDQYVDWGLQRAGRARTSLDRAFPLAYQRTAVSIAALSAAGRWWDAHGVPVEAGLLTVSMVGTLSHTLDMECIVAAARLLLSAGLPVRFVLCGSGDRLEETRRACRGLQNVILPGWVGRAELVALLKRTDVGLDPMPNRRDFIATVNNKAIEYLAYSLPVVASPETGVLHDLLEEHGCGVSYPTGDPEALATILSHMAANPERRSEMAGRAGELFIRCFDGDRVNADMVRHLNEVVLYHSGK